MGQAISSTQFFLYGKRHFTQTGYLKHVKQYKDPVQSSPTLMLGEPGADGVDLQGKHVLVTGANSGLGKQVALYCAAKGATLYMLCRSKERAEAAKQEIVEATNNPHVKIVLCDVSELKSVRAAAAEIQAQTSDIHALVCNAGVLLHERKLTNTDTASPFEATFASHLLGGTYLLSQLLLPQLQGGGRIVIVTSGGMYNYKCPNWETLTSSSEAAMKKFDGVNAYAYAKRAQVLVAERYAAQYPDVTTVTAHPGWTDTPAVDEAFGDQKKYLQPLREPWQGAEGIAWLVGCADASKIESGALYLDRTTQPKHLAGAFFSEGSYTKNTEKEVDSLLENLKQAAGL